MKIKTKLIINKELTDQSAYISGLEANLKALKSPLHKPNEFSESETESEYNPDVDHVWEIQKLGQRLECAHIRYFLFLQLVACDTSADSEVLAIVEALKASPRISQSHKTIDAIVKKTPSMLCVIQAKIEQFANLRSSLFSRTPKTLLATLNQLADKLENFESVEQLMETAAKPSV